VALETLREDLHRAIDAVIDAHVATAGGQGNGHVLKVERQETGDFGEADVLVGQTMRYAWGRDRGRIVVFGKASGTGSAAYYPWTEFVETDDGDYAAKLSMPNDPRKSLRDGDPLPPRLASANIQRNDQIFRSIRDGAALRLVVAADDAEAMIAHAYWAASLRSRI
jgi:hypothetical protein